MTANSVPDDMNSVMKVMAFIKAQITAITTQVQNLNIAAGNIQLPLPLH